jgi:hypothetical protein
MTGCNSVGRGITEVEKDIEMSTPGISNIENEESDEEYIEIDITDFADFKECFIDYSFTVTKNGSEENPSSFDVQGEFDLNQDGILEEIRMLLIGHVEHRSNEIQAYIKVDSQQKEINMDYTTDGEVEIIDLDKNDNYFEVACFDEGPSGDPNYKIYRYDGDKLYYIGDINTFASALADGKGKVISGFNRSIYFTPSFCSECIMVEDNTFVQKIVAIEEYIGKTYEFSGGDAYFWPCEEMPEQFEMRWEPEYLRRFEVCEIRLLDIYQLDNHTLDAYFVELPDGERGMLYFWIGD